jgi:ankyrin repeat protein
VAHSSKINEKNSSCNTPLKIAFQFNHMMIVEFLLGKGADPTIENKARLTPLELRGDLGIGYQFKGGHERGR